MPIPMRFVISEDDLRSPLSTRQLAEKYGCSRSAIWERRRRANIRLASPRQNHSGYHPEKRTPQERAVFTLFVEAYKGARKEGIPWPDFLETFKQQLPGLLAHVECGNETVRIWGCGA